MEEENRRIKRKIKMTERQKQKKNYARKVIDKEKKQYNDKVILPQDTTPFDASDNQDIH